MSAKAARTALEERRKERREQESRLQDLEARIGKYNEQLMQVKTNDEYKAMQKEIDGVKESIDKVEERILILMEHTDADQQRIEEEETVLAAKEQEAQAGRKRIEEERSRLEREAAGVQAEKDAAREKIGAEALALFNRIADSRNGVAVARAMDEHCMACKVRMRPQVFQDLKKNDRIFQCDSCSRILYYVAEAPADTSA